MDKKDQISQDMIEAAYNGDEAAVLDYILQKKIPIDSKYYWTPDKKIRFPKGIPIPQFGTAMHAALAGGYIEIMKLLMKHGANIDALDKQGHTALHLSIKKPDVAITKLLIDNGSSLNIRSTGITPRELAELTNNNDIIKLLPDQE